MEALGVDRSDPTGLAAGDIDNDGDLDLLVANWMQPHGIYLNNGDGRFRNDGSFGGAADQAWSVVLGDIDLDGDLDALIGAAILMPGMMTLMETVAPIDSGRRPAQHQAGSIPTTERVGSRQVRPSAPGPTTHALSHSAISTATATLISCWATTANLAMCSSILCELRGQGKHVTRPGARAGPHEVAPHGPEAGGTRRHK